MPPGAPFLPLLLLPLALVFPAVADDADVLDSTPGGKVVGWLEDESRALTLSR